MLIVDALTKSIGLIEKAKSLRNQSTPSVVVSELPVKDSSSCLELAVSRLPADFVIGEVRLQIIASDGPDQISGDMVSSVEEKEANFKVTPAHLVGQVNDIKVPIRKQSDKSNDAIYLQLCPSLTVPGMRGWITVIPSFLDPAGELITPIDFRMEGGGNIEQGVKMSLARAKNEKIKLVDKIEGLLAK